MQETIFESPAAEPESIRLSWLFTDAEDDTMVETNLDEMYAGHALALVTDDWLMH